MGIVATIGAKGPAMAHRAGLSIHIADKRFSGSPKPVFREFSLNVAPGTVLAVLGPSGVGKSTLLRLVAGIDSVFTGSVTIDGFNAEAAPPPGFVFQDPRLLPWLTATDNIRIGRPDLSRGQALQTLWQVGLADEADVFPGQLSGGMQRRVALARAIATNGRWLLLDEPFVSLDQALASEMQLLLARVIADSGAGVILVTHQPEEAARLADRAIVLGGRPASLKGDMVLDAPRAHRDPLLISQYRAALEALAASS